MFAVTMSKIAEFLTLQLNIYGATFRVYDFALWTAVGCMLVWLVKELLW